MSQWIAQLDRQRKTYTVTRNVILNLLNVTYETAKLLVTVILQRVVKSNHKPYPKTTLKLFWLHCQSFERSLVQIHSEFIKDFDYDSS